MSKTMIRFFTIADYEEEEIWLRKQHQSGWKIVKMIPHCVLRNEAEKAQNEVRRLKATGFLKELSDATSIVVNPYEELKGDTCNI